MSLAHDLTQNIKPNRSRYTGGWYWRPRKAPEPAQNKTKDLIATAKELGTALVLWAPILGYAFLGLYFWHIGTFPTELSTFAGLAAAAFAFGVLLIVVAPAAVLLPSLLLTAWERFIPHLDTPGRRPSLRTINPGLFVSLQFAVILWSLAAAFLNSAAAHPDNMPVALVLGLACAIATGLVAGWLHNGRDGVEDRMAMSVLVAVASLMGLFVVLAVVQDAPQDYVNSPQGFAAVLVSCLLLPVLNTLVQYRKSLPVQRHPKTWLLGAIVTLLVVVVLPSTLHHGAWLPIRVATLLGIRSPGPVLLSIPASTASLVEQGFGNCAAMHSVPNADRAVLAATIWLKGGAKWVIQPERSPACAVSSKTEEAPALMDIPSTDVFQLPKQPGQTNSANDER